ncbi:MAG: PEP-CTERM sorting domain-containing protein [Myxococcota bacterium]|nr:PEP-CTERM sorting domain-containing protein [Myxococcota bacterium]
MKSQRKLFSKFSLAASALAGLMVVALVAPAGAGVVQFSGKLRAGFGNSWNLTDPSLGTSPSNNGLPVCAVTNPFALQTWGTLYAQGYASQGTGTHASLMFDGYRPMNDTSGTNFLGDPGGNGGAFPRARSTCQIKIPYFANPRLRSRTQFAGGGWPKTGGGTLAQGSGIDFTGTSVNIPIPFFTGAGAQQITKGPRSFGGDLGVLTTGPVIYSSYVSSMNRGLGNGVQLGINTATLTPGGLNKLATFGLIDYIGGYLPTGPNGLGAAGVTHRTGTGTMTSTAVSQAINPGHQTTYTNYFGLYTPGGTSVNQPGNLKTVYGGNTVTPCVAPGSTTAPCPIPGIGLLSTFHIRIAAHENTTGKVQHTDAIGDYVTMRTTTGSDLTGLTGQPNGTTRRLQSVTPWSATIRGVGPFPIKTFVPALGFGGLAKTELDIVPVPEPSSMLALGLGAMGLFGLNRVRRRN